MKIAYFDLISGASGDMILGALVDAGLPFAELRDALNLLGLPEFELTSERVIRGAFAATKIDVHTADTVHARGLAEIAQIIAASRLPAPIQERALPRLSAHGRGGGGHSRRAGRDDPLS